MISVPRASAPPLVTPGLSTGRGRGRGFNAQQAVPMSPVGRGGPSSTSPISDTSDEWRTVSRRGRGASNIYQAPTVSRGFAVSSGFAGRGGGSKREPGIRGRGKN